VATTAAQGGPQEVRLFNYATLFCSDAHCSHCIEPLPQDRRFHDPAWKNSPFSFIYQGFLLNQQWWRNATTGISGVSAHHEHGGSFVTRQLLDVVSPVNFVATNPVLLARTAQEGGQNFYGASSIFSTTWSANWAPIRRPAPKTSSPASKWR